MSMRVVGATFWAALVAGCLGAQPVVDAPSTPAAIIWGAPFPELVIEIDYVEGRQPSPEVLETLVSKLLDLTDKESVAIHGPHRIRDVQADSNRVRTEAEVLSLHFDVNDAPQGRGVTHLHVLYLDGYGKSGDTLLAGLAILNVAVVFPDSSNVEGASTGPSTVQFERMILLHEVGHVLGLVDCGIPMVTPRVDPGAPCHSIDEDSVMHARVDTVDQILDVARRGQFLPQDFNAADVRDVAAFREQGRARAG